MLKKCRGKIFILAKKYNFRGAVSMSPSKLEVKLLAACKTETVSPWPRIKM